ncbi:MAG: anaerobic ribonucleoside-triphosphate reductase activating protein [Lachnospiraceae bacterium]|nr:anaerobic ribonucleoside-triphosphate reductase activating protein [Lachnospiraceae bacterium]
MMISGLLKTTLLDYPEHVAATVFLGGCNMCCPFCHNASLVFSPMENYTQEELLTFLKKRAGILEGVCISGGEPTIHPELPSLAKSIKDLGYKVKLDTNGSNPKMLSRLISQKLIDYVAMDVKVPFKEYKKLLGYSGKESCLYESLSLLKSHVIPYELRTTLVQEVHSPELIHAMGFELIGAAKLYLQNYVDTGDIIGSNLHAVSEKNLREYAEILQGYVPATYIRGEQSSSNNSTKRM